MQKIQVHIPRAMVIGLLLCLPFIFCGPLYAQAGAYPPSRQVFDDPAGAVVGGVRPGDSVQILQLETVFRQGRSERWAYITYGDRYTKATGWVNLDKFRKPEPRSLPAPRRYAPDPNQPYANAPRREAPYAGAPYANTPYSDRPPQGATAADIYDINISCAKDHSRVIRSCELQLVVDIQPSYGADNVVLDCVAELHWTAVNGSKRVSRQQGRQTVSATSTGHRRLALYFNFGDSGAKDAMVENQKCRTESPAGNNYPRY